MKKKYLNLKTSKISILEIYINFVHLEAAFEWLALLMSVFDKLVRSLFFNLFSRKPGRETLVSISITLLFKCFVITCTDGIWITGMSCLCVMNKCLLFRQDHFKQIASKHLKIDYLTRIMDTNFCYYNVRYSDPPLDFFLKFQS